MAKQVQIRRGPLSNLITLVEGELGFITDTKELVVGASGGNQFMAKKTHQHVKADITDFSHQHAKADITDFSHQHAKADITDFAHQHAKADITDFAHQHAKADIVDFPSSMPASDVQPWAKQLSKPTYAYSEITNKPSLGTVSPINLSYNASQYLRGDGTWANTPTGLAVSEPEARVTLFNGSQTINNTSPTSLSINTGIGGIKKGMLRIKYTTPNIPAYKFTQTTSFDYDGAGLKQQLSGSAEPPTSFDIMQSFLAANTSFIGNLDDAWDWSQGDLVVKYDSGYGNSYWRFIETNQQFDVVTNEQGVLLHQFEDPDYQVRVNFTLTFNPTNMVFKSPFGQGDASSYTLLSVELLYNK